MTTSEARPASGRSSALGAVLGLMRRHGVLLALALLVAFGTIRYENFLGAYNILSFLRYNAMFGLISVGMAFVIMTGGIDLSVGAVAALASVVSALLSPYGLWPALLGGVGAGAAVGLTNGLIIGKLRILPFITTLATLLAARGMALLLANNQSVSVSWDTDFVNLGEGDALGLPIPALIAAAVFALGALALDRSTFGRHVLALGGNAEAARLMGLPVDRVSVSVYALSGILAGLAGVILASQFAAGQPTEGNGWELFAIAAVVVGGTLLTGGMGTIVGTLSGVLLLGLIFNILNFENGRGWISLSAYWQSVIRGVFLLIVVLLQSRLARRRPG